MIRDSLRGYGLISILFHWGSAAAILLLFGLGFYVVYFGYSTTTYLPYAHLHYALGIAVFAVIILRIVWRLTSKTPASLSNKTTVKLTVSAIKFLLYVLVLVVIVSGYLICTSDGQIIDVFGVFKMPALIQLENAGVNIASLAHKYVAWVLGGIIILHVGAALIHHFIVGDRTLKRMLLPVHKQKNEL